MTMKTKSAMVVAALAMLAAAVVGWRAHLASRAAEAEGARLVAARAASEADLRRLQTRLDATVQSLAGLEQAVADARGAKPATPPAAGKSNPPAAVNPAEALARDPKLQALYISSRRANFESSYGPFFARQGLTPAQIETLSAAQGRWQEQDLDLQAVAREKKLPGTDPSIATLRQSYEDELRAAQRAVLGAEGMAAMEAYGRLSPVRDVAGNFAGAAAIGDVPLSGRQVEQLTEIMAGAAPRRGDRLDATQIDWDAVDAQARTILSPVQFALFQKIEPIGGGQSRWMARFNKAFKEATGENFGEAPKLKG